MSFSRPVIVATVVLRRKLLTFRGPATSIRLGSAGRPEGIQMPRFASSVARAPTVASTPWFHLRVMVAQNFGPSSG
ncbi:hypothetical protein TSOC_008773 [Tetrabaena socialis]|uniref:Uncharacterized protein n=1 Tax=Tetrabaena socialis TaxID=47790 RepID=A0A2J7ZXK7_9CHLO|nr:hypothetical protein TSOC_008773 [Tetrabaena socialis]|eukprot:PNH05004.1 hypothetical protein TSOC_008773 [Tetrabaena socialis]